MEKFYQTFLAYLRRHPYCLSIVIFINKVFPLILFTLYPLLLGYLLITNNPLFLVTFIKPCIAFLLVSLFRKVINRPRPYEAMNIIPLKKHKQGQSFPSRHAISAMIIALSTFPIDFRLGLLTFFIALCICISRILAGVHYISDVIASIILAFIIYII